MKTGALINVSQRMQRFHNLLNSAAFGIHASIAETALAQFDEPLNVHFKGVQPID